jgi:hypothetical protein
MTQAAYLVLGLGLPITNLVVLVDGAKQCRHVVERYSWLILASVRGERTPQIGSGIALAAASGDTIAEHLRSDLQYPVRQIVRAALLNFSYCG